MNVTKKYILMSIKPKYASLIRTGEKTVELRRKIPKMKPGDIIVVYESSPNRSISMCFTVESVLYAHPNDLWEQVCGFCGISKNAYDAYFSGSRIGYGIKIGSTTTLSSKVPLSKLKSITRAPQNYSYLDADDYKEISMLINNES